MKRCILHIDNSTAITGAYKALLSWCLSVPEYRHIWVLPEGSAVVAEVRQHFTVYTLPFVEIGRSPGKLLKYLPALFANGFRLKKIIQKEQPQLLHVNDLYNLVPYAARFLSKHNLPIVVHARMLRRSFPSRIYDFWKRWHLKRASGILAVSEAIKKDWDQDPRVEVIYDPILITEKNPPYHFRPTVGERFRFIYLANYIRGKGQEDALEAIRLLKEKGITNFQVDFYGGTMGLDKNETYRQELQAYIKQHSLEAVALLNGATTDVETTLKTGDAALHFSHSESFGMVCYEALYYGLPVISSDCGGPAEMIMPGISGILLPVGDTTGFADAMEKLMGSIEYCNSLSQNAAVFIRQKFTGGVEHLSAIFANLIS